MTIFFNNPHRLRYYRMQFLVFSLFYLAVLPYVICDGNVTVSEPPLEEKPNPPPSIPSPLAPPQPDPTLQPNDQVQCPEGIQCVPFIQCPAHVRMQSEQLPSFCKLEDNTRGLCCTTGYNHSDTSENTVKMRNAADEDPAMMRSIIDEAKLQFSSVINNEVYQPENVARGHPSYIHNMVFRSSPENKMRTIELSNHAIEQIFAARIYQVREHINPEEFQLDHIYRELENTPLGDGCYKISHCPMEPIKYRFPSGKCNNPIPLRSSWGEAGSAMERLLPPAYEDGIWAPRQHGVDGSLLPSARKISRILVLDQDRPHSQYNLLLMQFGQLIAHDVTQSSSITMGDGQPVSCCAENGVASMPPAFTHYACMPIMLEPDDEFYRHFHQGCINFVRSKLSPNQQCRLGYGRQSSKVTHFIDASVIYGSDRKSQDSVRTFEHGRLRMFHDFGHDLLPLSTDREACLTMEKGSACFHAGDGRVNQLITLVALHVLLNREHNRIAGILNQLNPFWNDEIIFQETRRIVIAEFQHIIYNEYLPLIVGTDNMKRFNLYPQANGYSNDYNVDVNPALTIEFTTAAFRFGHSTVAGKLNVHRNNKIDELIDLPEVMFNPARMRQRHFYDEIFNTMVHQPMQQADIFVTHSLSRYMFRSGNPFGFDLAAINIQRGRDHGLQPYNAYLELGGRTRIRDFSQFGTDLGPRLASIYNHPDNIDLWVGGLLESPYKDALVGATFAEIIADQFSRFRRGDRYFYENGPNVNPGHFTPEQLQEIRKVTLARLICDNSDGIAMFAQSPRAFKRPEVPGNEPVQCQSEFLPRINLRLWQG